jgi:hypothetical protein
VGGVTILDELKVIELQKILDQSELMKTGVGLFGDQEIFLSRLNKTQYGL